MALSDDLDRISAAAAVFASPGERVAGLLAAEPLEGGRVYLCAYESAAGHAWLALDADGRPVEERRRVRDAVSLAALCEVAEETAGGGDLADAARAAARAARDRGSRGDRGSRRRPPQCSRGRSSRRRRVARTEYLDAIGAASRRLEQALGEDARSPFAAAMQQALVAVEELAAEVEGCYKGPLS